MTMTTDRLTHAIDALAKRIEPRMSRHPVTVVQHAGSVIARVGEAIDCQFEDGDDLVEAAKELVRERDEAKARVIDAALIHAELVRERDEARAEVERLREAMRLAWTSCGCCKCVVCGLAKDALHPKKAKK
jgi:hypothetical protein